VGGSIIWRGGSAGAWASAPNWSGFLLPDGTDTVSIGAGDTVAIGAGVFASVADLNLAGATLQVDQGGTLRVGGTIALAGGTLTVAGTLSGGTLASGGDVLGEGGTLDGTVVQGGLSGLGDLTITTATANANAAQPITPTGTLTLAAGRYDRATFRLDASAAVNGVVDLAAAPGAIVVLGATSAVVGAAGVLGGGTLVDQGSIDLAPATTLQTEIVYQPSGRFHALVGSSLTWTASVAPTLEIAAARFVNSGGLFVSGGTLDLTGANFRNTGMIRLADATAQTPQEQGDGSIAVATAVLTTSIDVAASVTAFANSGTIGADRISFDGAVRLAQLGTLAGALSFAGSLDLGGGTLAATAASPVTITGTVLHGTLEGTGLALDGAAVRGVVLAGGTASAAGTLHVLSGGGLTLDAGAVLAANAAVVLTGGGAAIVDDGTIAAQAGATVSLQAGLGGAGTVELGANAVITVAALAPFAKPIFLFDPGASLLALPGTGIGATLADLHADDVLDLTGLSSTGSGQASATIVGATLEVAAASGQSALLSLRSPAHGLGFTLAADGHGGTLVSAF
jgi:hypothetical protein